MLEKIDKSLKDKIISLNSDSLIDVIVYTNGLKSCRSKINNIIECKKRVEIPFLDCLYLKLKHKDIYKLAELYEVNYITHDARVSSLIYKSKNFLNYNSLNEKINAKGNHSCVVIDTGVYPHIDFCLGKNRIIKFVDLINNKDEMYDDNGHGTFVTGVICANSITNKYDGMNKNVNIINIKALDENGETSSIKILEAMQWVIDNKANYNIKIVCMSFGSFFQEKNDPLIKGVEILWNNGIVVVSAGGNSGPERETIMSPGASKKIITVGSLDDVDIIPVRVADFSSRGPVFNYYKPDMVVPGVNIISNNVYSENKKFYTTMSGTSMSTPMVAGIISLMFNHNINYTPDQIKYMLVNSCVKITGDRNSEGYGYLDLSKLILI